VQNFLYFSPNIQAWCRKKAVNSCLKLRSMMANHLQFEWNHILAILPENERVRLAASMEFVPLLLGQSLYEKEARIRDVFFPTTGVVSLLNELEDGSLTEIAVVGNEGIVGIALVLGGESMVNRAVVQTAGHAYRLNGQLLKNEFIRGGTMQRILLNYTQALLTEMAQTLVCVRHHSLDQQFSRWLLLRFDRLTLTSLQMSQDMISNLLGVRRATISELSISLSKADLIKCGRGSIILLDRAGLEARTCECYGVIREKFDRLLPRVVDRI
jgi:CRP-like cAMP-binding protein